MLLDLLGLVVILIRHLILENMKFKIIEKIWQINILIIHYHAVFQSDKVLINQKRQIKLECQIRIIQVTS